MTTLSIGGVLPEEQQQYQTNLKLRSWNNNGGQERGFEQQQADMTVYNMSGGSNGLKRKRQSELPSVAMYDNGEARIVLGLGHPDDSSSMDEEDEDSGVVLGLGQSYNGSGSANTNSFCGGDETVHSGHAVSDILGRKAEQPLLRLNSMGDLRSSGSGWSSGSHLGLGTYHATDSSNAAALRLGLSDQGAKGAPFPPLVDEGSSTARLTSGGYMPSLLMGSQIYPAAVDPHFAQQQQQRSGKGRSADEDQQLVEHDLLMSLRATASGGTTSTSGASGSDRAPKVCKFRGCGKGPRGASGLCIAHGGGRRCQKHGCNKGAEGRTVYCKAHGGGRRCQNLGCTKSAEGKTDFCIGHGGGRRCSFQGCDKAARGRSGLCIRHGGGKRCQIEGCTKSAEGYSGLCISHGGGRRCQFAGCTKGAQGSTMFCKAHGGGKRCIIQDCNKGAEGSTPLCKGHGGGKRCAFEGGGICTKSVHGGTLFCVAHGGGKRCAVEGCGKSARGRTDFCVRHGGGKRCKVEACGKSAQGSTDFCKAHGGGKRCQWGQEGSNLGDVLRDKHGEQVSLAPCDKFARGKTGLCAAHSALVTDRQVHGGSAVGSAVTPGLAPGLFRGLVTGASQSRPTTTATSSDRTETTATTATTTALTRPVASVSVEMRSSATDPPVISGMDRPAGMWAQRDRPLSSMSQGFSASMETTNVSVASDTVGGTVHGPYYRGSDITPRMNFTLPKTPGVGSLADSTAVLDLNPRTSQPETSASPFHQPYIPPQVLVPLSMQKDMSKKNGRPPRPQLSDADEGVQHQHSNSHNNMLSSLPEGRVHGSYPESRVHGGASVMSVMLPPDPEGRVRGGSVMALLNKNDATIRNNPFNFGLAHPAAASSHHNLRYPTSHHHHGTCAVDNGMLRSDLSLERNNSLGIDVGQFLAHGVDLN